MNAVNAAADSPRAGQTLTDTTFVIDKTVLDSHYQGLDLPAVPGAPIPTSVLSKPDNDYILEAGYAYRVGHLWMRQGWSFHRPLERDVVYQIHGKILEIYPRRDRNVVRYQTDVVAPDGQCVARSEHHQSFLAKPVDDGAVALRDPKSKPGARKFDVPEGTPFESLSRRISVEMCGTYFHGKSSYHTDASASRELGFEDIVVGGRMTMAYAVHALESRYGERWFDSGQIDVKFTNPVWALDTVTVHGVETGRADGAEDRTGAFVWLTNQDDTVVLVATASVRA